MCMFHIELNQAIDELVQKGEPFDVKDINTLVREKVGDGITVPFRETKYETLAAFEKGQMPGFIMDTRTIDITTSNDDPLSPGFGLTTTKQHKAIVFMPKDGQGKQDSDDINITDAINSALLSDDEVRELGEALVLVLDLAKVTLDESEHTPEEEKAAYVLVLSKAKELQAFLHSIKDFDSSQLVDGPALMNDEDKDAVDGLPSLPLVPNVHVLDSEVVDEVRSLMDEVRNSTAVINSIKAILEDELDEAQDRMDDLSAENVVLKQENQSLQQQISTLTNPDLRDGVLIPDLTQENLYSTNAETVRIEAKVTRTIRRKLDNMAAKLDTSRSTILATILHKFFTKEKAKPQPGKVTKVKATAAAMPW